MPKKPRNSEKPRDAIRDPVAAAGEDVMKKHDDPDRDLREKWDANAARARKILGQLDAVAEVEIGRDMAPENTPELAEAARDVIAAIDDMNEMNIVASRQEREMADARNSLNEPSSSEEEARDKINAYRASLDRVRVMREKIEKAGQMLDKASKVYVAAAMNWTKVAWAGDLE